MTAFSSDFLTRQKDLIPVDVLGTQINVIGAGAIGSHVTLALARMGLGNITVYDYDVVDDVNMNNQGYNIEDIGQPKVEALRQKVFKAIGFDIEAKTEIYKEQCLSGIVLSCVDSMEVREAIWKGATGAQAVIDGRMGAEYARMFTMKPGIDDTTYLKTITKDEDTVREPCTAKSTIYTAYLLSGMMCKAVKDIITDNSFTRIMEWNIRENKMLAWGNDGKLP